MRASTDYHGIIKSAIAQRQFMIAVAVVEQHIKDTKRALGKMGNLINSAKLLDRMKDGKRTWTETDANEFKQTMNMALRDLKGFDVKSCEGERLIIFISAVRSHFTAEVFCLLLFKIWGFTWSTGALLDQAKPS